VSPYVDFQRGEWANVELPALEPGYYQLVRDRDDGEPAVGPIWVSSRGRMTTSQPTVPASTPPPSGPAPAGCPNLPQLVGATVRGETLVLPEPGVWYPVFLDDFGGADGGAEAVAVSENFRVQAALPVRPVIDFVGERTAQEGPVLLWWAGDGRVEAWVSAEGCDTLGISVTGGTRDQNAQVAAELAMVVADEAGLDTTEEPATDCPAPGGTPGTGPQLFFYCPFDDIDQIPRPVAPRDPFLETPTEALQALFDTSPPAGWGAGIPLVLRGADVEVTVTEGGIAGLNVDYDFEGAPINGFSTSFMAIAYSNQLQATLFQFPEIDAIDLDTICCGEWGGQVTRAEWQVGLAQATQP
jgi:hypothetical protein